MIVPNYEEDLRGSMHKKPKYIRDHWPEFYQYHFNKNQLKKMGFDISQTEAQIMSKLPYYKIYDSGTTKWTLEIA